MKRTGRVWVCPSCGYRLPEAEVEWSEAVCSRTQKCRAKPKSMSVETPKG